MKSRSCRRWLGLLLSLTAFLVCGAARGADSPKDVSFGDALIVAPAGRGGRVAVPVDPIGAQFAAGTWQPPKVGEKLSIADGQSRTWEKLSPGKDGSYQSRKLVGGGAFFMVPSEQDRVMVLAASGDTMVWVNGEPRVGDPYSHGYVQVPVELKKGPNQFLFSVGRGQLHSQLTPARSDLFFNTADVTAPDLIVGQPYAGWAAVPVLNATTNWQTGIEIRAQLPGAEPQTTSLPALPPLSVSKVPFQIAGVASTPTDKLVVKLELKQGDKTQVTDRTEIHLRVLKPEQTHKRTFRSKMDSSIQYYAVVPATPSTQTPGLTLTLHGAGVEGLGQAACFSPKPWTHVVAATNRRPYGFDWEDWGRLDALEVLDDAMHTLKVDPHRVWLTGHSMGGHGTWQLGVTYPDKFAAIGPSAGWISMMSYAGVTRTAHPDALAELFQRAASPADTLALVKNLSPLGVYILHGDQDDNVPVEQARTMRKVLADFHADWDYHERIGAGHWWGNPCVDWPEMFDFFSRRSLTENGQVRHLEFATASPAVSGECHWALIQTQQKAFKLSSIKLTHDPDKRSFAGKTENVACLALDIRHLKSGATINLELDGQHLADVPWPGDATKIWLEHSGDKWRVGKKPSTESKSPARSGPFRDAFRNGVVFVVGTKGSPEENAWALHKARFDSESFWYRGNGFIPIVTDQMFDSAKDRDHNVVLYGNADTNAAWAPLLEKSPVQVKSGSVSMGGRNTKGDDFGCLFVRPRLGSEMASVGVVGGTGIKGMRLTDRLPFFVSGIGYPDCVLLGPDALTKGLAGVKAAGFFGNDWRIEQGEFAWR
jgi:pimeloyl-ACP methyl ester carboxylesterase